MKLKSAYPIILILVCTLSSTLSISAQEIWSLEKCVNHALENSLDIQNARIQIELQKLNVKDASFAKYPSVNGSVGLNQTFGKSIDPTENTFGTQGFFSNTFNFNSSIPVYNHSRIKNQKTKSDLDLNVAEAEADAAANDLALNVALAYLNVLFAKENVIVAEKQLALNQKQLKQINLLIEAGSNPRSERLDVEAQIALSEGNIISRENEYDINLLTLKQYLLLDPSIAMTVEIPEIPMPDLSIAVNADFTDIYLRSLETQPLVDAYNYRLKSALMDVDIAEADLYPSVFFGLNMNSQYSSLAERLDGNDLEGASGPATYFIDGVEREVFIPFTYQLREKIPYFSQIGDNFGLGFGISANIPIFNGYTARTNIERAKLNIANVENQAETYRQQLRADIQSAIANGRAAQKTLEARVKTVEAMELALSNAEKRFQVGAMNTYDFISAKNQFEEAQTDVIIAKYDYIFKLKIIDFYLGIPIKL